MTSFCSDCIDQFGEFTMPNMGDILNLFSHDETQGKALEIISETWGGEAGAKDWFAGTLRVTEVLNMPAIAEKLARSKDAAIVYFNEQLSELVRVELSAALQEGGQWEVAKSRFVREINGILMREPIYNADRFGAVNLRPETLKLLSADMGATGLMQLNRRLFGDVFPLEVKTGAN